MSSYTLDYQFKVLNGWNINLKFRKLQGLFFEKKVDYNHGLIRNQSQSKLIRIRWVLGLIFQNKIIWSGKVDSPFHLCVELELR
jgi:hypothetical protein